MHSSHRTGGSGQLQRLVAVVGWASTTRSAARARSYPETRRRDWMDGWAKYTRESESGGERTRALHVVLLPLGGGPPPPPSGVSRQQPLVAREREREPCGTG